jgi:hypothetical protein
MERTIISRRDIPAESRGGPEGIHQTPDDYSARLLKYIPTEVIALYLTLASLLHSAAEMSVGWEWFIFLLGVIATPLYLWQLQRVRKTLQLVLSTLAYGVWVFALGGPFAHLAWYAPVYGGILLCVYTFFIPILEA